MAQISKDLMAALLVITIIISIFGTLTAMYSMLYKKQVEKAPGISEVQAKVRVNLVDPSNPAPAEEPETVSFTGKVFVNLLPETEGG